MKKSCSFSLLTTMVFLSSVSSPLSPFLSPPPLPSLLVFYPPSSMHAACPAPFLVTASLSLPSLPFLLFLSPSLLSLPFLSPSQ